MLKNSDILNAKISWLENGEPYCEQFNDIYFSTADGLAESEYVFLKHNQFPLRFSQNTSLNIAETGFGTGLNFLATAYHWLRQSNGHINSQTAAPYLRFISVEKYPLTHQQLSKVYQTFRQRWPCLSNVCDQMLSIYPDDFRTIKFTTNTLNISLPASLRLILLFGDAAEQLDKLQTQYHARIDAWYLDGFSPAKNSSMWTPALFRQIARLSHSGTTLSTFTAAGGVRRGLHEVGFNMYKARGFAQKREMLYGVYARSPHCGDNYM